MALQGDLYQNTLVESGSIIEIVTYPTTMEENDPNYDKRGTTVTESYPNMIPSESLKGNYYFIVEAVIVRYNSRFRSGIDGEAVKVPQAEIRYHLYNNQSERNDDYYNNTVEADYIGPFEYDFDYDGNPIEWAYNTCKTSTEYFNFVSMSNA